MFNRNLPRGLVFLIDFGICLFSLIVAYAVRFNFVIPEIELATFKWVFPVVLGTRVISFFAFNSYAGIMRYTSTQDAKRIFFTVVTGSLFFVVLNPVVYYFIGIFAIPYSIIIIDFLVTFFLMIFLRIAVKLTYQEFKKPTTGEIIKVAIFGAGEAGVITKRTIDRDNGMRYRVAAFLDDNPKKSGKKVEGVQIYHTEKHLDKLFSTGDIQNLIISIQKLSPSRKHEIIESCLKYNVKVLTVPPASNWINGELSFGQMKDIRIDDLLERDPIQLDYDKIEQAINNKRVLISGAAGSIGSELVRQLLRFNPSKVILLDCAESPLYELESEISESSNNKIAETVIGDIRNEDRMRNTFSTYKPQVVFHAAAYKHVPMMENNPSEAILTNIYGTKILADLSVELGVEKFVMVSTDKAVNPTNIMGASKRVAEIYTQSLNKKGSTRFITTRFGNVLGSNGSVIPRFRKQIENRQPITITHPDITRFFMTIPEACQLVLEAGAIGNGGEVFIFDMGKSVKIVDLATKMVQLSGLELGKDIQLVFTGLRPGEKLYEELLANEENTIPTHHHKILIAKVNEYNFEDISRNIDELIGMFGAQNNEVIVKKLKEMVPEFISNNSVFEELDVRN